MATHAQPIAARIEQQINDIFNSRQVNGSLDVDQLVGLCEELELLTWSSGPTPMHKSLYAIFLAGLLTLRELNRAKYLWKRIPNGSKTDGLSEIWAVGQALWKREIGQAYAAIAALEGLPLPVHVQTIVATLKASIREYNASLLSRAYTSVSTSVIAQALGLTLEDALKFCASQHWDVKGDFAFPNSDGQRASVVAPTPSLPDLDQLHKLSSYILHLEAQTSLKI
ncbi:hypothetical protein DYB28_006768 [Aphanomyces astaci]|uniref:CSN8/PSMD8/EIF3K domain-containing protein n=1 Tax=Aphanomyces astaci TaxID=112090 RepID=A0A9X8DWW0_APHAT|nr:hypothetical protein DYB28_006768 [Aphanomyces astaci]